jgi:Esterase-like activity of phytase
MRLWAVLAALACVAGAVASGIAAKSEPATASFLAEQLPIGTDNAGRAWNLGGFSGLATVGSSRKEFWTVTDRGPNDDSDRVVAGTSAGLYCAAKPSGKVIFLPDFNPQLVKIHVDNGEVNVQERVLLHDGTHAATGLANIAGDESSWVQTNPATKQCDPAPKSAFGVDTEGVVIDPRDGSLWLADEYRPSIMRVAADGEILSRIVPADLASPNIASATNYANAVAAAGGSLAVQPSFPSIVNAFRKNRGFEDLAMSPDGRYMYTALQSPMDYKDGWASAVPPVSISNTNRNLARNSPYIRVFRIDVADPSAPVVDREWIYLLSRGFSSAVPDKISDIEWAAPDVLLIEERDDDRPTAITNFYRADFSGATNLLDPSNASAYALAAKTTVPTLEMTNPVPAFITPAASTLAIDFDQMLTSAGFVNSKIEGVTSVINHGANPALLVAVNDNDFDLEHLVDPGTTPDSIPTQVDVFPQP